MDETVGKGIISVEADTKGLGKDISKKVDAESDGVAKSGHGLGSAFGSAFKVGALAFAGVATLAASFAKDSLGAASDLNESINAVNVVFGDAAKGVLAIGDNSAKSLGLSKNEFNGLAVKFSSFASTISGPGGDVAKTLGDMSSRAADFASVMNIDVGEAAGVFQSALAGETEPIKKYGLDLSAATVQTFAYSHGIGKAGKELTAAQKVQATYALLMESTNKVAGDFANTSDGLANSQRIAKATFEDSKAAIGKGLMPVMAAIMPVVQKVAEWFGENLPKAIEWLKKSISAIADWVKSKWPPVREVLVGVLDAVRAALGAVAEWVKSHWPPVRDALVNALDAVRAAFAAVVAWVQANWPTIRDTIVSVFKIIATAIASFISGAWAAIQAAFGWLMDNKEFLIGAAIAIGAVLLAMFVSWAASAVVAAVATAAAFLPFIAAVAIVAAIAGGIIYAYNHFGIFRDIISSVKDVIMNDVVPAFQAVWAFIVNDLVPAFQAIWNFISTYIIPIISTLVEVYIKVLVAEFNAVKFVITEVVVPALKAIWSFIQDKVIPIFLAIVSTVASVATAVGEKIADIVGFVTGIPGKISGVFTTLWDGLKDGITAAKDWVGEKIDAVVSFATGLPGRMIGIFSGMWDGIKDAFRSAINFIIRGWNSLHFGIPEFDTHIPGVGKVGGGSIGVPQISELATGGVFTGPTLAVLGELGVTEIAAPEPVMRQIVREESGRGAGPLIGTFNNNRKDLTPADLHQVLAMARLAS